MARVTEEQVRAIIETDADIDVTGFILDANVLVNRVNTNAVAAGVTLGAGELAVMEKYLAAHMYALRDLQPASIRAGKSQTKYQGKWGTGLDATSWGQMALSVDSSGALATLTGSDTGTKVIGAEWLGSERVPVVGI